MFNSLQQMLFLNGENTIALYLQLFTECGIMGYLLPYVARLISVFDPVCGRS